MSWSSSSSSSASMSAALVKWAQPFCTQYGFKHLAPYLPTVLASLSFWLSLQYLSAKVSPRLFPQTFANLRHSTKVSWHVHFVALAHACIITPMAARMWYKVYEQGGMEGNHPLARNRTYGFDHEAAQVYAVALGYFVWDLVVSALVGCASVPLKLSLAF